MKPCLVLALFLSIPDSSGGRDQAKELLREANGLFNEGKLEPALALYKAAYDAHPNPRLLYNIAVAEAALDRPLEAARDFDAFLEATMAEVELEQRPLAQQQLRELERELGRIEVRAPRGALVTLDGRSVGVAPVAPIRVLPGTHDLEVTLEGYIDFSRVLQIEAGQHGTEVAYLPPVPSSHPPTDLVVVQGDDESVEVASDQSTMIYERWWFWAGIGVVVAGAIAAGVVWVDSREFKRNAELGVVSTCDLEPL